MPKRKLPSYVTPAQRWARRRNWCKGQITHIKNVTGLDRFRERLTKKELKLIEIIYLCTTSLLQTWDQNNAESKENYFAEKE